MMLYRTRRKAMEALQSVIILAVGVLVLTAVASLWPQARAWFSGSDSSDNSALKNSAILVAVVGGILALLAWLGKEISRYVTLRSEMAVLEVLSDKKPRTIGEIQADARGKKHFKHLRYFPGSVFDAAASLLSSGKLCVDDGKYSAKTEETPEKGKRKAK